MTLSALSRAALIPALLVLTLPARAETPAPAAPEAAPNVNMAPDAGLKPSGGPARLALAQDLFALGQAQGDALTVLAAARLAASVIPAEGGAIKKETRGAAEAAAAPGGDEGPHGAPAMFALARDLAAGDAALLDLITDAEAETTRGAINGAQAWRSRLTGGGADIYEIAFAGNAYAEVAILGDGDANLDMVITDQNGNVICFDVSPSDQIYCDFVPAWDGFFYVTVENAGTARNTYDLVTN